MPRLCKYCYICPVSTRPSITMSFIHIFNVYLWLFIGICQNICFMISPEIYVPSSRAVCVLLLFFTTGIRSSNCSGEKLPPWWQGMTEPNLIWRPVRGPQGVPDGKGLPCLSLVDVHSLVQCRSLLHLLHTPEGKGLLLGLEETLFLERPCL